MVLELVLEPLQASCASALHKQQTETQLSFAADVIRYNGVENDARFAAGGSLTARFVKVDRSQDGGML